MDCGNGTSLRNQRGDVLCGFLPIAGSWTPLEQIDPTGGLLADKPPIDVAFINTEPSGNKLYYGQIFYYKPVEEDPVVFCLLELVDSAKISESYDLETDDYQPLWCALSKALVNAGTANDYEVPVIAYGVKTASTAGQLRVASIPSSDYVAAPPDGHFDPDEFWFYQEDPEGGVYSEGIEPQTEFE